MRKVILFLLIIFPLTVYCQEKITATVFYSPNCKHCIELKKELLPKVKEKYKDEIIWREISTLNNPAGLKELIALSERYGKHPRIPAIHIGDTFLVGTVEIKPRLEPSIQKALRQSTPEPVTQQVDIVKIFNKIPVIVIIFSGLIDGINPCAFAVIVFFVSFLAVYGYKRRDIIFIGASYCLAVFIAYFLIGLGLFQFLYSLSHIHIVIKVFYYFVALFCFILAGLAFYDYYRYKKTKISKDQILQLPPFLKKRINIVIGSHLRERKGKTALNLIISSFIVGFLVSLLEAVCTGQIYVPVIVSILKYPALRLKAILYLLLYNLMFIFPLILIFLLSLAGFNSNIFNSFLKRHLGAIKILLALAFLALGIFVIGYEQIHIYLLPFFKKFIVKWAG